MEIALRWGYYFDLRLPILGPYSKNSSEIQIPHIPPLRLNIACMIDAVEMIKRGI